MNAEERQRALRVARDALDAAVIGRPPQPIPGEDAPPLSEPGACFVTLRAPGHLLRGCLGTMEARRPLAEEIRAMTAASATRDPRFVPVSQEELPHLSISISVLSPMRPVPDRSHVVAGEHGVMVRRGSFQGVLLPQVAVDHAWDSEQLVRETCRKAGLPAQAADDPDTEILVFTAEVLSDEAPEP